MTRKSGHIWRIWPEMTPKFIPKPTKVTQIHSIVRLQVRQNSPTFAKFPPTFANLATRKVLPQALDTRMGEVAGPVRGLRIVVGSVAVRFAK